MKQIIFHFIHYFPPLQQFLTTSLWFFNTKDGELCEVLMPCLESSIHWTEAERFHFPTALTKKPYLFGGNRKVCWAPEVPPMEGGWGRGWHGLPECQYIENTLCHEVYFWCQLLAQDYFYASCLKQMNTMGIVAIIASLYCMAVLFEELQASDMIPHRDSSSTYFLELFYFFF